MTDSQRDSNQVSTITALSNADGSTIVPIKVNASTHVVQMMNGSSGSDLSGDDALRDNNGIPVMIGVSSSDGITPVPVYADPATGELLTKSS